MELLYVLLGIFIWCLMASLTAEMLRVGWPKEDFASWVILGLIAWPIVLPFAAARVIADYKKKP